MPVVGLAPVPDDDAAIRTVEVGTPESALVVRTPRAFGTRLAQERLVCQPLVTHDEVVFPVALTCPSAGLTSHPLRR